MTAHRAAAGDGDGASRSTRRRPAHPAPKPRHSQKQARRWRRRAGVRTALRLERKTRRGRGRSCGCAIGAAGGAGPLSRRHRQAPAGHWIAARIRWRPTAPRRLPQAPMRLRPKMRPTVHREPGPLGRAAGDGRLGLAPRKCPTTPWPAQARKRRAWSREPDRRGPATDDGAARRHPARLLGTVASAAHAKRARRIGRALPRGRATAAVTDRAPPASAAMPHRVRAAATPGRAAIGPTEGAIGRRDAVALQRRKDASASSIRSTRWSTAVSMMSRRRQAPAGCIGQSSNAPPPIRSAASRSLPSMCCNAMARIASFPVSGRPATRSTRPSSIRKN